MDSLIDINLSAHPDYLENAAKFIEAYQLAIPVFPVFSNVNTLKMERDRICRFCQRAYPEVRFKKEAHLISELLGNKILFSDFECDECNQYFGNNFENDLANYLGIHRTINGVKTKKKVPHFKSSDGKVKIDARNQGKDNDVSIHRMDVLDQSIAVDLKMGQIKITCKKQPFTPIKVYKAILKFALSVIPTDDVQHYQDSIDYLIGRTDKVLTNCLISGFILPSNYVLPLHGFLFKKRNENAKMHTHLFALYIQNIIFAIPLPLNSNDLFFYNTGETLTIPLYPPLFTQFTNPLNFPVSEFCENFSSNEKVRNLEDELLIQLSPEDTARMAQIDKPFNWQEIVEIKTIRND